MSKMENKSSKLGTTAFLILITSTVEMPGYLKYPLLAVAAISFIIAVVPFYNAFKRKRFSSNAKK